MSYGLVYELTWEWFLNLELDFYFIYKDKKYYFNEFLYVREQENWNLVTVDLKMEKFILNLPEIKNIFQTEVSEKIHNIIESEYIENYLVWVK